MDTQSYINAVNFTINSECNHLVKGMAMFAFNLESFTQGASVNGYDTRSVNPISISFTGNTSPSVNYEAVVHLIYDMIIKLNIQGVSIVQ